MERWFWPDDDEWKRMIAGMAGHDVPEGAFDYECPNSDCAPPEFCGLCGHTGRIKSG